MSPRLKILHVVYSLEPGGMENGLVNVARRLAPEKYEVHVACLEGRGEFAGRLPNPEHLQVLGKPPGFSLRAVFRLARIISQKRPHLIHTHNLGPLIYAGLATGLGLGCPILQGEHSELTAEECRPRRLCQRRWLYRGCRKIHTVSRGLRDQLVGLGFAPQKIETIINGVDTERFAPSDRAAARARLGLPLAGQIIGIVGRFGPYKRHDVLIEAFNEVAAAHPGVRLLVVGGGGPERERIQQLASASPVAGRIHFAGFQENPAPWYQAMDLLAVPSVNEGLSNALLEAMASGVPALCHQACGHAEVIRADVNGWVANLIRPAEMAAQLTNILADPGRLRKMGVAAREHIVQNFSLARMVCDYERIYAAVAGVTPLTAQKL